MIEIEDGLAGYQFINGDNDVVLFESLSRVEQIRILNSFASGYKLFIDSLKENEK